MLETTNSATLGKFIIIETYKHEGESVIRNGNSILNVITDARRLDVYPPRL